MAELVGAFGVPHMPGTPLDVRKDPQGELAQLFGSVKDHVDAVDPDLLVVFDTDHFFHWYYQRMPVFGLGVAPETCGPGADDWPGLPSYSGIPVAEDLGRHVYLCGLDQGFDLTLTEEFEIDHSIIVPLHMLSPEMKVPIRLPRVIGKSRRDGQFSSWCTVMRAGTRRRRWLRAMACRACWAGSSSAALRRIAMRSPTWNRRAVGTIGIVSWYT